MWQTFYSQTLLHKGSRAHPCRYNCSEQASLLSYDAQTIEATVLKTRCNLLFRCTAHHLRRNQKEAAENINEQIQRYFFPSVFIFHLLQTAHDWICWALYVVSLQTYLQEVRVDVNLTLPNLSESYTVLCPPWLLSVGLLVSYTYTSPLDVTFLWQKCTLQIKLKRETYTTVWYWTMRPETHCLYAECRFWA